MYYPRAKEHSNCSQMKGEVMTELKKASDNGMSHRKMASYMLREQTIDGSAGLKEVIKL